MWKKAICLSAVLDIMLLGVSCAPPQQAPPQVEQKMRVPLYGMFETFVENTRVYHNPFSETELRARFTSPSGRGVNYFGFYDGGNTWRQRFMPDEPGTWLYNLSFSDGAPGAMGVFECVAAGAKPGPWKPDPENPRWLLSADGNRFAPVAVFADCYLTPLDWKDAIQWCKEKGFNTLVTPTFNTRFWAEEWDNLTAFALQPGELKRIVDYDRYNLQMWGQWDDMIRTAGLAGIYIGAFEGPCGKYGGQENGKYPPNELVFSPAMRDRFDTERNKRIIRYLIARQGAFWNLAYWSLGNTEVFRHCVADEREFIEYGEYFASAAPFGRLLTAQDCEQVHGENRRWLSGLNIPASRKLNTVQTAAGNYDNPEWTKAGPNNQLALDAWGRPPQYGGFPVLSTEGLWEGQGRAKKPLRVIWGFLAAGAHAVWADWNYENADYTFGSIGRCWSPVKPLEKHLFRTSDLGANCSGDEELPIALEHLKTYQYWKMKPHNELVAGGAEAYCLAEPGSQYMIYAPEGGTVKLDLNSAPGPFTARWLDPRQGTYTEPERFEGGAARSFAAPGNEDWVLSVTPAK